MMKDSQDQLDKLLKGYPYYVYVKELRRDDPANPSYRDSLTNKIQKKNDTYVNYNQDGFCRYGKTYNIAHKTRKTIEDASMYVLKLNRKTPLDIDEISLFVTLKGVYLHLFRNISGIKKLDSCIISYMGVDLLHHPQLEHVERALNRKIRDAVVWSDFGAGFDSRIVREVVLHYDSMSNEEGVIIGITTIKVRDVSELPTLPMLNKALDGLEKIVRDDLE